MTRGSVNISLKKGRNAFIQKGSFSQVKRNFLLRKRTLSVSHTRRFKHEFANIRVLAPPKKKSLFGKKKKKAQSKCESGHDVLAQRKSKRGA